MRKSINASSFYGNWNWRQQLALAKESGFEAIELNLDEEGLVNLRSTPEELREVAQAAEQTGLSISGLATGLYWGNNPVSNDETVRQRADVILARQFECAEQLGLDAILVVPGVVGADFIPGCEVVSYDAAYERAQAFIRRALPLAEKLKVHICVENVWNKFLLSPLEMRDFIDSFDHAFVGSYLDVGNTLAYGYPDQWIRILGSRIKRVHFKDYRRNVGTVDGFCDLLSGDVDWPAVMNALGGIDYDGWAAAEMIPPVPFYKHCPEVLIANTGRAMEAIFKL